MRIESFSHPLITAGVLVGVGLGGFFDGILFHQLLQTHNMLSAVRPPISVINIEVNMFWDGLFHVLTYCTTILGLTLFWRALAQGCTLITTRALIGSLLVGWGTFNVVEGIIDHYLLGIHHVVEQLGLSVWDAVFLLSGMGGIGVGLTLIKSGYNTSTRVQPLP